MRVLLLHNRYRAEGGEERAVAMQADLLRRRGHQVEVLERDSSGLGRIPAAAGLLQGGLEADAAAVAEAVIRLRADVVHAHNLHPRFGWRALAAARAAGARTVLQLHNFRLFCAIGVAYRDGEPCHDCHGRDTRPGLRHRCRGGLGEAAVYAAGLARQQPRILGEADGIIALSAGHLALLRAQGLEHPDITLVPNFVADDGWGDLTTPGRKPSVRAGFLPGVAALSASGSTADPYALVAARLVAEKGVDVAIRAAVAAGVSLTVAGDGPDRPRLEALARELGTDQVTFTGWLSREELAARVADAAVVLVPSRCEEAFAFGALDALAAGVAVIASPRGGLVDLAADGAAVLADPDDPAAWEAALRALWSDPAARRAQGERGLAAARERYSESAAYAALMRAYRAAD